MPIVKCEASKATPDKGIAYIMDPEKVIARGSQGFMSDDPKKMAGQMLQTMHLFRKGYDYDERKYYHVKISFHPKDRPENGGTLTPERANQYAARYVKKMWPGREVAWAVQDHGSSIHIHFIVAACEQTTGRKLDIRDAEYRGWKDYANTLAAEFGFSILDWRKATAQKRGQERLREEAICSTFAEVAMRSKKKAVWKDELREIIDRAVSTCCNVEEFRKVLKENDVILTRCSNQVISYQLRDHKACRGDTLGGDYTAQAIRDALQRNEFIRKGAQFGDRDAATREKYRIWGRIAGIKREEIDSWCDMIPGATWKEKQELWEEYKKYRDAFWEDYRKRKDSIRQELDKAYRLRRKTKDAEWVLNPRNRRRSMMGIIVAGIYIHSLGGSEQYDQYIEDLLRRQEALRKEAQEFKRYSNHTVNVLKTRDLPLEEYTNALGVMQAVAEDVYMAGLSALEYWAQRYNAMLDRGMSPAEALDHVLQDGKRRSGQGDGLFQIHPVDLTR